MNYIWENDKCKRCGIVREMKNYRRWQRVEGVLINGIWEYKVFYTYGTGWHYGKDHKFEKPSCKHNFK